MKHLGPTIKGETEGLKGRHDVGDPCKSGSLNEER